MSVPEYKVGVQTVDGVLEYVVLRRFPEDTDERFSVWKVVSNEHPTQAQAEAEDAMRRLQGLPRAFNENSGSFATRIVTYNGRTRHHLNGLYAEENS